jgi:fructose-1,6-bisphosphatase
MVAVKEGRIADWSEGTKRQIEQIFEISHSVPRKAYNSKEAS